MTKRLSGYQISLLETLNEAHHNGMKQMNEPFGVSALAMAGAGSSLTGLLKRGLAREKSSLFYITEDGQLALQEA